MMGRRGRGMRGGMRCCQAIQGQLAVIAGSRWTDVPVLRMLRSVRLLLRRLSDDSRRSASALRDDATDEAALLAWCRCVRRCELDLRYDDRETCARSGLTSTVRTTAASAVPASTAKKSE